MLGNVLHPQLVDNLAMGLVARFNIKADVKDVVKFINKFGIDDGDNQIFIPSGFPIGKVQSEDHLKEIKKKYSKGDLFYNITTGKTLKAGNPSFYYGQGWCVKRNTPAYEAIRQVEKEDNSEESTQIIEIEERDGWEVLKDTRYIWCRTLGKIIGRLDKNGKPGILTQKHIEAIKHSSDIPWERVSEEKLAQYKLPFKINN